MRGIDYSRSIGVSAMPMPASEVRAMMKRKGWTNADLAAHWGHGVSYVSWLINNPHDRPRVYDDAFKGLQDRRAVEVVLEARHKKRARPKKWGVSDMYPVGRVFVTQNSRLGPEEGSEMAVVEVQRDGANHIVRFEVLSGDAEGEIVDVPHGEDADSLSDTGQDRSERQLYP